MTRRLSGRLAAWLLALGAALAVAATAAAQAPGAASEQAPAISPATATKAAKSRAAEPPAPPSPAAEARPPVTGYRLPPDRLRQAEGLYRIRTVLYLAGLVYGIAVIVALLAGRVGARYRDWAEAASRRRFVQAAIVTPLLVLTLDLLALPLGAYEQRLSRSYGLSVQGWGSWWWDWAKGELIGIVLLTLLVWGLYGLLRRSPKRWWFYGWLAAIPVVVFLVFITPMVIDPMFNTFEPLAARQPSLAQALQAVARRGGLEIPPGRMFEMRASDKVTTYNAYVTGVGASKRVVVWDNTAKELPPEETMFIFGHELGHYALNHIWYGLGLAVLGLLASSYLAFRTIGGMLARWGARWGIRDLGDWASIPALLLVLQVFALAGQPVGAAFSRYIEHQADIFGLEIIHGLVPDSSQVAARAFQDLGQKGLSVPDPNPFFVFWTYSHPPTADRLRFALSYRPWDEGRPGRFIR
jgi:Zn-dependent protease with chaperone function